MIVTFGCLQYNTEKSNELIKLIENTITSHKPRPIQGDVIFSCIAIIAMATANCSIEEDEGNRLIITNNILELLRQNIQYCLSRFEDPEVRQKVKEAQKKGMH